MSWLECLILGFIQGLTEFLPISSSAHLRIIGPILPNGSDPGATFTAITQLGTELAVLIYFRKDIKKMILSWYLSLFDIFSIYKNNKNNTINLKTLDKLNQLNNDAKLAWLVIIGTIPICIFGLLLKDFIENNFRNILITASMLIIFALILFYADNFAKQQNRNLKQLTLKDGILLGLAQSLALIPGVSRSGGTITAGLLLGLNRESATRFSFLLAIPAVLLSGFYMLIFNSNNPTNEEYLMIFVATLIAFITGYLIIAWFMNLIINNNFNIFVIYRIILGSLILIAYSQNYFFN